VPPGDRLRVNADVAPSGYLNVGIRVWGERDELSGRTLAESDRVIGNALGARVSWRGEEAIGHKGRPISLRVSLRQARLFGFEFD
ncbi:MAG TPA: hypothetical protein P5534_20540, partial [Candidatus Paceibacterota bacterium]|nr:hypothetical protein [Candidatus Paceibacterota bacterium]